MINRVPDRTVQPQQTYTIPPDAYPLRHQAPTFAKAAPRAQPIAVPTAYPSEPAHMKRIDVTSTILPTKTDRGASLKNIVSKAQLKPSSIHYFSVFTSRCATDSALEQPH